MINDKMAKMAVNTIDAYCAYHDGCNNCEIRNNCMEGEHMTHPFACLCPYPDIDTFGNMQKPSKKPPKFDITLKNSAGFRKYINEIFLREAEKYGLPMNPASSIKWSENGKIKVTFVDDNMTNYIGVAKCHPNDAFNPEVGVKLAIERAAKQMREPFIPNRGEVYYYVAGLDEVYDTINYHEYKDILNIALGNCFKTLEKALDNTYVIMRRAVNAIELLKKCRDDNAEDS